MDLLCCERTDEDCRAYADPAVLNDDRVLQNLLKTEERYVPSRSYIECMQTDVAPFMRKVVAEWMFEVCYEQKCHEEVFPLSMNYLDRFLSICWIRRTHLQLLGSACLLLASKLRESVAHLTVKVLIYYTDNCFTLDDIWRWEQLVVLKLKWEMSAVTPGDFLMLILSRLSVPGTWDPAEVMKRAKFFISLSVREYEFSTYTPSMIAASSIVAALQELGCARKSGCSHTRHLLDELTRITAIEQDYLRGCLEQIEELASRKEDDKVSVDRVRDSAHDRSSNDHQISVAGSGGAGGGTVQQQQQQQQQQRQLGDQKKTSSQEKVMEHEKAGTPTDVRDVHF